MADLEEIPVARQSGGTEEQTYSGGEDPPTRIGRNARRRTRKGRNPSGADNSRDSATPGQSRGNAKIGRNEKLKGQTTDGKKEDTTSQELRARFYEHYNKAVEEYNKRSVTEYLKDLGAVLTYAPRRLLRIAGQISSAFSAYVEMSACRHLVSMVWDALEEYHHLEMPPFYREPGVVTILFHIFLLPICILVDAIRLQMAFTSLIAGLWQLTARSDLYCVSWVLRTSPDVHARLAALNYLATMTPTRFDVTIVMDCFNTLIGCVRITNGKPSAVKGLERLGTASALCCLHTLSHFAATDTMTSVEPVRLLYTNAFPPEVIFDGLPFSNTLGAIHTVFYQNRKFRVGIPTSMDQMTLITWRAQLAQRDHWWEDGKPSNDERTIAADVLSKQPRQAWRVQWKDYEPSNDEHTIVACALAKFARFEHRRRGHRKVPRWLLRFAFHSLSQHPLPPTSVIANCLSIVALDLGCSFSNATTPYKSVQLDEVSQLITQKLGTMARTVGPFAPVRKAVSALLPYAVRQERHGRYATLGALLDTIRTLDGSIWNRVVPVLFDETSHLTTVLVSPYVEWHNPSLPDRGDLVTQWAAAASAVPYTEEIGRSVVDVLLNISTWYFLLSHIPVGIWGFLEKRPHLPPKCYGRSMGGEESVIRYVRALGDIKILKSYLLLVWSEWDAPWPNAFSETRALIREDFGGADMRGHREDLIKHLDHVLAQLGRGLEYLQQQKPRLSHYLFQEANEEYRKIREVLLEVDRGTVGTQIQSYYPTFTYTLSPPR